MLLSPLMALVWGFSAGEITPALQPETSTEAQKRRELGNTHKCGRLMTTNWTNQHMGLGIPSGQHSILYTHHKTHSFLSLYPTFRNEKIIKMRMQMEHDEYAICRSYCSAGPARGVNRRLDEEAASSSKG